MSAPHLHRDPSGKERLADLAEGVEGTIESLVRRDAVTRIWDGDHTLWRDDPTEVADRLGWLHVPHDMFAEAQRLQAFAASCTADGFTDAVVMGMGGSSLFPEVVARTFGPDRPEGALRLHVLDTTDPAAVERVAERLRLDRTLFIASSKSGTTIETRSHLAFFRELVRESSQFVAITDAGTPLAEQAADERFRATFENRPDIGGRYSALSYFGLVPAALAGVDVEAFLESALAMADALRPGDDPFTHPGLRLGAIMGAAVQRGVDKLTLIVDPEVATFGLWIEQLLAESTGKEGTGIVPIVDEPLGNTHEVYGPDRLVVSIGWHPALDGFGAAGHPVVELPYEGRYGLGAHVLLWEFATAVCGAVIGVNPFDQPNVAEAKEATARVLRDARPGASPIVSHEPLDTLLDLVQPGDYLAIQAYVDPASHVVAELQSARERLRDRFGVATTLGLGPRYLHSTGQLHKGGPPTGVFVQVVGDDVEELPVPGEPYGFATLKQAQAAGDLEALQRRGLRAARVPLADLLEYAP
jgi:glucose-6-phosphate isomerase